jgi:two-component system cell cycle sensor histidine kinase/response regulator CckA
LNSCAELEDAIEEREPEIQPGIGSAAAAETMGGAALGETMIGERTIDDTTIGVAFAEAGQWGGPETILLVEDEAFVRKVTAEVLESAGYRLVIARSAAEALEACRGYSGPLNLILADVVMPGMSGRELATELESFYPRARVLFMSGYAEQLVGCELSPYCKGYLAKPFSIGKLLRRVREVLDQRG